MVKICLRGECKNVQLATNNGESARCTVRLELDHLLPLTCHPCDVQLMVPTEFASLLEVGLPLMVTLEQSES
jgi:hypothetical protein